MEKGNCHRRRARACRSIAEALHDSGAEVILVGSSDAADFPAEKWQQVLDVNLSAVFYLSQLAGKVMIDQRYGKIINLASMTSFFGSTRIPAYSASKGAVPKIKHPCLEFCNVTEKYLLRSSRMLVGKSLLGICTQN